MDQVSTVSHSSVNKCERWTCLSRDWTQSITEVAQQQRRRQMQITAEAPHGVCGVQVINTRWCHRWPLQSPPLMPPGGLADRWQADRKCLIGLHWTNTGSYLTAGYSLHLFPASTPLGTWSTWRQALFSCSIAHFFFLLPLNLQNLCKFQKKARMRCSIKRK